MWDILPPFVRDALASPESPPTILLMAQSFVNIIIVILLTLLAWVAIRRFIRSRLVESRITVDPRRPRAYARAVTLRRLLEDVARYVLAVYAGYLVLREIGLDLTPVLASVSVIGIAISLGAQSLVRDILTGLFLLFEDQLHVGDFVEIVGVAGAGGIVEDFGLRATKIRDIQGELHFVPNGQIGAINRFTRGYVTYFIDVRLPDGSSRDVAARALLETADLVARQIDVFVEPPRLVDAALTPASIVRLRAELVPLTHWVIEKELVPRAQTTIRAALAAEAASAETVTADAGVSEIAGDVDVPTPTFFRLPEEVITYRRRVLSFVQSDGAPVAAGGHSPPPAVDRPPSSTGDQT